MSTRSHVYAETTPGSFIGIYVHYDGQPDTVGASVVHTGRRDLLSIINQGAHCGLRSFMSGVPEFFDTRMAAYNDDPERSRGQVSYVYRKRLDGSTEVSRQGRDWERLD